MSPQTLSDQMMLNLNYETVQEYNENVNITKKFTGELRKLVDIEFPDKMDALTPQSSERSRMSSTSLVSVRIQTTPRRVRVTVRRRLTLIRMLIRSMRKVDKSD